MTAVPWIELSKGMTTCLDTEVVYDPQHPRAVDLGYRRVFKGDRRRPLHERCTQIETTHEDTLALADMIDRDKVLHNILARATPEQLQKIRVATPN